MHEIRISRGANQFGWGCSVIILFLGGFLKGGSFLENLHAMQNKDLLNVTNIYFSSTLLSIIFLYLWLECCIMKSDNEQSSFAKEI